jgi:hypothetical protein
VRTNGVGGSERLLAQPGDTAVRRTGTATHAGLRTQTYAAVSSPPTALRSTMTYAELAAHNGGRLPLGPRNADPAATVPVTTTTDLTMRVWADPSTARVVDIQWQRTETVSASLSIGPTTIGAPTTTTTGLPAPAVAAAVALARQDADRVADRRTAQAAAWATGVAAAAAFGAALVLGVRARRRRADQHAAVTAPSPTLVRS